MKKSRAVKQKVMGRPRTGVTPLMGFRADPVIRASIVKWAEKRPDIPSLSEAIRRLVELGLTFKETANSAQPDRSARAAELAAKAINEMIDPSAPPEEHAQRRRRLTKGPLEFRDDRVDLPKRKT
jgi:hypothetical protein